MKLKLFLATATLLAIAFSPLLETDCLADEGQPIAIRKWENGFSIESMWGLKVAIGMEPSDETKEQFDLFANSVAAGKSATLRRLANAEEVEQIDGLPGQPNDLLLTAASTEMPWTAVAVDRVAVYVLQDMPNDEALAAHKTMRGGRANIDQPSPAVSVIAIGDTFDEEAYAKLIDAFTPQLMVVNKSLETIAETKVEHLKHNTVAFSSSTAKKAKQLKLVSLTDTPYELPEALSELFARKEKSQNASADFFKEFSVEQMNFEPSNGTHTPRWNTEHMMGRELLFFSQIYHALDPSIPVMDLNPKQMPKDYKFAHADWTGAEEARQTKRVEDFTRRFAYLTEGVNLRKKAPGSRYWSLRSLLLQMERHYNEHTDNVRKKMELKGWPDAPRNPE